MTIDFKTSSLITPKQLPILYQDEHCIAINKPSGMLVHRSPIAKHETEFVLQTLRNQIGQHVYPVHRLDRPTSGVLLFALDKQTSSFFSQAFERHHMTKKYWAAVRGYMGKINGENSNQGFIDYPLKVIRDKIADKDSLMNHPEKPDQEAITYWHVLNHTEQAFQARDRYPTSRYSLISLEPKTGRKHQLRRHMKHIFHPIVGDTSYGDHHQNRAIRNNIGISRLMLHARELRFENVAGDFIQVIAPVDEDWKKLGQQFNWHVD